MGRSEILSGKSLSDSQKYYRAQDTEEGGMGDLSAWERATLSKSYADRVRAAHSSGLGYDHKSINTNGISRQTLAKDLAEKPGMATLERERYERRITQRMSQSAQDGVEPGVNNRGSSQRSATAEPGLRTSQSPFWSLARGKRAESSPAERRMARETQLAERRKREEQTL